MSSKPHNGPKDIIFHPFTRPGDARIHASDAKLIGELRSTYISANNRDELSAELRKSERLVISTPNADFLPQVNLGNQVVSMCTDGRWGAEDWAQWPQWYFDGQEHFPYILRKPRREALTTHPLHRLWWNMSERHFVPDFELEVGRLLPSIAEELYTIRTKLMEEIRTCECNDALDWQKLQDAAANMRHCTAALRFTPQSFHNVMITVGAAQRYCLETRALLDKITKWDRLTIASTDEYPQADESILGCITDRIPVVYDMLEKGVPVWFVRPPSQIPHDINIVQQCAITEASELGIVTKRWPGAPVFYQGPLSREMHASIGRWKPGVVDLRFLVSESEPGNQATSKSASQANSPRNRRAEPYSKSQAMERVASKGVNISVNMALFHNLDTPHGSRPLQVWEEALSGVNRDTHRVIKHPHSLLFRGYALPCPHIFCGGDGARNLEMMLGWLVIRTSWMGMLGESKARAVPLPSPQQWRTYLRNIALELELMRPDTRKQSSVAPGGKVAQSTHRGAKSKETVKVIFTLRVPSKKALQFLIWHDRIVWRRGEIDFPINNRQLLVWDAQEHNFHLELFTLDRCVLSGVWETIGGARAREMKLHAVFPQEVLLMADLPSESSGLATEDWERRCPFVEAFRNVIMDWPGDESGVLSSLCFRTQIDDTIVWDKDIMQRVESLVAKHYCQTFFDYFGRAPCVPHIFPLQ